MSYQKQAWRDYDDTKTELQNMQNGAVVTPERLNHIETGIANSAERAELEQTKQEVTAQLAQNTSYSSSTPNYLSDGKKEKKAIVSFIADDAPKNDIEYLFPIMFEKNAPLGISVATDNVGKTVNGVEYMTWEELKQAERDGVEILSHSHQHRELTVQSEDEIIDNLETSKRLLNEKGFIADGFVYPGNAHGGDSIRKLVKRYYKYAFTGSSQIGNQKISNIRIHRYSFDGRIDDETRTLDYYKSLVDQAIENDDWLVFMLHTAWIEKYFNEIQRYNLREIIDYIRSKGVEIVSPREGFNRFGNTIETDSITMRADGAMNTAIIGEPNTMFASSPITDFPTKQISVNFIAGANTNENDYPVRGRSGYLITYHNIEGSSDPGGNKQEYKLVRKINTGKPEKPITYIEEGYVRFWVDNAWTDWILTTTPTTVSDQKTMASSQTIDVTGYNLINLNQNDGDVEVITSEIPGQEITFFVSVTSGVTFKQGAGYQGNTLFLKSGEDTFVKFRTSITFKKMAAAHNWIEV